MQEAQVAGYDYGNVVHSPNSLAELEELEATVGFTDRDRAALRRIGELVRADEAEAMVDDWRKLIGSQPHLARWFFAPDQKPNESYKAAVRPRFVLWVIDLLSRPFDQAWLDYQWEIGLRHTPAKKNLTDHADTPPHVPLRYLIAFMAPVLEAMRLRLKAKELAVDEIDRLHAAWSKAVILSIALWSRPYTHPDLW
jgi:hypothetical protein